MIASLPRSRFRDYLKACPPLWLQNVPTLWPLHARENQKEPPGDWEIWLLMGGRGSGKTRTGAEWIRERVCHGGARYIGLVAPSLTDAREVMLDGESGLLNIGLPSERPTFIASRRRLEWSNGAVGHIFSAEDPDSLRGPQFDTVWADEFCAWRYPGETLSNVRLALRLGETPRLVITTTPRPIAALRALIDNSAVTVSRAKTHDNAAYLSRGFITAMDAAYGGTRLGRQELDGDILEDSPGGLWTLAQFDALRLGETPALSKIIIAIDPPITSGPKADRCGIIIAGLAEDSASQTAIILRDASIQGLSPQGWAARAAQLYKTYNANYVLAEVNQGGEMVKTILRTVDPDIAVRTVYASTGKTARAEPVAALYEQGRVRHAGMFKALEDELCAMGSPQGHRRSPDRADALVWAVTDLLLSHRPDISVRRV